ncbi:MAG: sensor histidine kinase [Dehalococcoidia bacterium]
MSLRARLLAGTLLVAAIGLLVASAVTYRLVRGTLVDDLDDRIMEARFDVLLSLGADIGPRFGGGNRPGPAGRQGRLLAVAPGTYAEWRGSEGTIRGQVSAPVDGVELGPPDLSGELPEGDGSGEPHFFDTGGLEGGPDYRVAVDPLEAGLGTLVIAQPLTDVQTTLRRLVAIEAMVGTGALILAGLVGLAVVRLGLRPLDRVVATADAITAGDLEQRVPFENERTEVGHLGRAFNTMVSSLQESLKQREASENRLRAFVADASHELRTPLTSLRGYSEVLEREDLAEADRTLAGRRMRESADRMSRLVDDMLTLARLDEAPEAARAEVDLSEVVEGAAQDFRAAAPGRRLAVEAEPGCRVEGDRDQLVRVVGNLLRNIQTHTPPGTEAGVTLRRDGDGLVLEVWDAGPGIPTEMRERVFERFVRVDKSRARERGGSGLGLSIVASVVAAHGGSVAADERKGGGTLFRVRLPSTGLGTRVRHP